MNPITAAAPFSRSQISWNVRGNARSYRGYPTTSSRKPREATKDEHLTENCNVNDLRRQVLETDGQKSGELVLEEIEGDLFTCPSDTALVCGVARDMQMKTPLLQQFKKRFSCDKELTQNRELTQKKTGQIVTIMKHKRLVYFLIVKPRSCHQSKIYSLKMCLDNLREHILENNIKKIAMPTICCGRNELEWDEVRNLIQDVFQHIDVHITVYKCNEKLDKNDSSLTDKFAYNGLHSSEKRNSEHVTKWNRNVVPILNANFNCGYITENPQMVSEESNSDNKFKYIPDTSKEEESENIGKRNRNAMLISNANFNRGYVDENPLVSEKSNSNLKFKGSEDVRTNFKRDLTPASNESHQCFSEMDGSCRDYNIELTKSDDSSTDKFTLENPHTSEEGNSENIGKRNRNAMLISIANFNRGYVDENPLVSEKSNSNLKFKGSEDVRTNFKRDLTPASNETPQCSNEIDGSNKDYNIELTKSDDNSTDKFTLENPHTSEEGNSENIGKRNRNAMLISNANFNREYVDETPQMVSEKSISNIKFEGSGDVRTNFKRDLTPAINKSPHCPNEMYVSHKDYNSQLTKSHDIITEEKNSKDEGKWKRNVMLNSNANFNCGHVAKKSQMVAKKSESYKKFSKYKHKGDRYVRTYSKRNYNHDESLNVFNDLDGIPVDGFNFEEIDGDLFDAPQHVALAHCVAEDFRMDAGIAIEFKRRFGSVDELLYQVKRTGDVAVIKKFGRFIYYLVTKKFSNRKPTMETLMRSLLAMKRHVQTNNVKKIAMPTIGCGLDLLNWDDVKSLIIQVFKDLPVHITVYKFQSISGQNPKPYISVFIKNHSLNDMDHKNTLLAYFIGEDPHNYTRELRAFNQWREIVTQLKDETLTPGQVVFTKVQDQTFVGLVCIDMHAQFNYRHLSKCLWALENMNLDDFSYMGIETQTSDDVKIQIIFDIFKYKIPNMKVWICCPNAVMRC